MQPRDRFLRIEAELMSRIEKAPANTRENRIDEAKLLQLLQAANINTLHHRLINQSMPWKSRQLSPDLLGVVVPRMTENILKQAQFAMDGHVSLMGSSLVQLGSVEQIDWYKDYKSNLTWPFKYFNELDPADLDRPSDVKFPWELSRLQWLIPVAQAWRLTSDDRYAAHIRAILNNWITKNPYAWGINWGCTMEPAMRVIVWCWLYQMVADAPSWQDRELRFRFLRALYLHLRFIRHHLEITDINGNHLVANAAALVLGGTFFGVGKPSAWRSVGWRLLKREIQRQVYADGVDFEGSIPYHRLVAELFHLAAAAVNEIGSIIPDEYRGRLLRMAEYTEAYTRPDGSAPVIGDNDDARSLPLGGQAINDHRYLPALIRHCWAPNTLTENWKDNASECLWWWGGEPKQVLPSSKPRSALFPQGGAYILRSDSDWVYFEAGPVGLGGRGGHGHNDALSFEAVLDGVTLIVDPGCLVYTGNYELRNHYRSTGVHSTPQINNHEINRFVSKRSLWLLHEDAHPVMTEWREDNEIVSITCEHDGYTRLKSSVRVIRNMVLNKKRHSLVWKDSFNLLENVSVKIPLQLAPGVIVSKIGKNKLELSVNSKIFVIDWVDHDGWQVEVENGYVSPQYGISLIAPRLIWSLQKSDSKELLVNLYPAEMHSELRS